MGEVTQRINISVVDAVLPPNTGILSGIESVGSFVSENYIGITVTAIVAILLVLAFFVIRKRYARTVFGRRISIASIVVALLVVPALLLVAPSRAAPMLILDKEVIDVLIEKPELSVSTSSTLDVPGDTILQHHFAAIDSISDSRIAISLNGQMLTSTPSLITEYSIDGSHSLDKTITIASDLPVGEYVVYITYSVTEADEFFMFTIDTRMIDALDTDQNRYSGTATEFWIPVSGMVDGGGWPAPTHPFDWIVNCGGGQADKRVTGVSSDTNDGILCTYDVPGEYQITITPYSSAYDGWMNAFGFSSWGWGIASHGHENTGMIKSIDSMMPRLARTRGAPYRFASLFNGAFNAVGIPSDLFALVNTSGDSDLSYMFEMAFAGFAANSTTTTIPVGLFDTIDTSSAVNMRRMFSSTFIGAAMNSSVATIPAGLFDFVDTSNANSVNDMFNSTFISFATSSLVADIPTGLFDSFDISNVADVALLFAGTFANYASNSPVATIPDGLFNSIDTSNATNLEYMFVQTFSNYATSSPVASIPEGLFDSIDTSSAVSVFGLYDMTFWNFAANNPTATIPADLFDSLDLSNATNVQRLFHNTFLIFASSNTTPMTDINSIWGNANFAGRITAANAGGVGSGAFQNTFNGMGSLTGEAQVFIDSMLGGIVPDNGTGAFVGTQVTDLASLAPNWR